MAGIPFIWDLVAQRPVGGADLNHQPSVNVRGKKVTCIMYQEANKSFVGDLNQPEHESNMVDSHRGDEPTRTSSITPPAVFFATGTQAETAHIQKYSSCPMLPSRKDIAPFTTRRQRRFELPRMLFNWVCIQSGTLTSARTWLRPKLRGAGVIAPGGWGRNPGPSQVAAPAIGLSAENLPHTNAWGANCAVVSC
jgi:hypothetical protein